MVRHKHEIDLSVLTKFAARLIVVHTISFTSLIRFLFFFCFVFGVFFLSQCVVVFCLRVVYFSSPMFTLNLTRYWKFMHFITILFVAHFYVYLNCCVLDFSFCFCFFFWTMSSEIFWSYLILLKIYVGWLFVTKAELVVQKAKVNVSVLAQSFTLMMLNFFHLYYTKRCSSVFFFIHIITEASNVFDLCEYKTRYNNRILTTCFSSAPCAGLNFQ